MKKPNEVTVLMTSDQWWEFLKAKGKLPEPVQEKKSIGFNPYWYKEAA